MDRSNFLPQLFRRSLNRWRYGKRVIVVSGLPRSGTSMLMRMLEAGGTPLLTDDVRASDVDNPRGYYEFEPVRTLEETGDTSWLRTARGKAIKVISHLLRSLPDDNFYAVILVQRDPAEVIASQNLMLDHRGEKNPLPDAKAMDFFTKHLVTVRAYLRRKANFELLEIHYRDVLREPLRCARTINEFLGGNLDVASMADAVEPELYRNRLQSPEPLPSIIYK